MTKVAIVHRSYEKDPSVSHAGLGVCAINTAKTLNQRGVSAVVWPLSSADHIVTRINMDVDITHIVVQAPWIPTHILYKLASEYPHIQFAVNCHSNVGFLQTEPQAMTKMIDLLDLQQVTSNIHCAGNSHEFVRWMSRAYQAPTVYLPNLYYIDEHAHTYRPIFNGGTLRIGIFGAPRPQKNVMTGVAGAIELAQMKKVQTQIWVNGGRNETHGKTILEACKRAISRNPFTTYHEFPWAPWPEFRRFIGSMDLLIQASYTESFNQVTADGVVTGVPTVVSSAIRWAPASWRCDTDNAHSVALAGHALLSNPCAAVEGLESLIAHNDVSFHAWTKFLNF